MPQWFPILATLVIAILTVIVNAIISTKIKFAPDSKTAVLELKQFGSNIVRWVVNLLMVALLIYQVSKPQPLTRIDALLIMTNVAVLLFTLITVVLLRLVDSVYKSIYFAFSMSSRGGAKP